MKVYETRGIRILDFNNLLMGDWDLQDDPIHNPLACTINTREDAYKKVAEFCKSHPDYLFLIYDTPGGVRAFCVSHTFIPGSYEFWSCQSALGVDPMYQELCYKSKATSVRVSPKPKRANDYVAVKKFKVGNGKALPQLVEQVIYHDQLIKEAIAA